MTGINESSSLRSKEDKHQPWKNGWPQEFKDPKTEAGKERGRAVEREDSSSRVLRAGTPSPQGGKGAAPFAAAMIDGTKVIRLDDKAVLKELFGEET